MLEGKGYNVAALQGNMAQNQRQKAINGFRSGQYDVLVATDIAARGIDVTGISHVINYDMPDTVDAYTHRIGRTGRAHAEGEAFTFMVPTDIVMVRDIERILGSTIERRRLPEFDYGSFTPEHLAAPATQGNRPGMSRRGSRRPGASGPRAPMPSTAGGYNGSNGSHAAQPQNGKASAQSSNSGSWGRPSSRRYSSNQVRSQG
jgi:ATP-dependent RNA helicase RhlE